ncbi:hypothetical protein [Actinoplanes derwentensis]|uniref:Uncharacterized protein n=1 Tax=Actinoplanes derwentensis TaxID=113562 RepID=A0A1H2AUI5_9ACTN|nr:hypothetical protein [Actinoplanes derwentensis]GID84328.1 hypothetical protein Ade03nite_32520 [Actinoplanes derwentensis]SDT49196.1 hypothetical protein SAMN04489716_4081 [Actinoplanes derwentensis]
MTEHQDRLREAFNKYENDTPDPAAVYARVEELSRKYTWRRRGAQAAGGVALSAGLIAGITQLPAVLPAGPAVTSTTGGLQAAAPAVTPSAAPTIDPSAPLTEEQMTEGIDAYFQAGYGYDNAVELAKLWKLGAGEFAQAKAVAGQKLLAGETLPVKPVANEDGPVGGGEEVDTEAQKQIAEFFYAGYDYDDAVKLAGIWKLADPSDAKYEAGKRLLAGKKLPFKPDKESATEGAKSRAVSAFFDAGYDYDDAVKLAGIWKLADAYEAKIAGGERLLDGKKLPFKP